MVSIVTDLNLAKYAIGAGCVQVMERSVFAAEVLIGLVTKERVVVAELVRVGVRNVEYVGHVGA